MEGLNQEKIEQLKQLITNEDPAIIALDTIIENACATGEAEYKAGDIASIEQALSGLTDTADLTNLRNQGYCICRTALETLKEHVAAIGETTIRPFAFAVERIRLHRETPSDAVFGSLDDLGMVGIKFIPNFSDYFAAFVVIDSAKSKACISALINKGENQDLRAHLNNLI